MSEGNINIDSDRDYSTKAYGAAINFQAYQWEPKEDITTYELAQCMPILIGMTTQGSTAFMWKDKIESLSEACQRHFELVSGITLNPGETINIDGGLVTKLSDYTSEEEVINKSDVNFKPEGDSYE